MCDCEDTNSDPAVLCVVTFVCVFLLSTFFFLLYTIAMVPQFSLHSNMSAGEQNSITYFAITDTRGKHTPFGIKQDDRSKHMYVIGKSGMGKSTMLENMAVQDIQRGDGVCFIDPHGGTAEKLMQYIPEHRVKDVLYFAPFDLQYPISFNVLENVDGDKRHLVVAGLMSAFEKIWVDAWSARMAYILQNTIAALLEFPGATLLGVNRMYIDKEYRKNVIAHVTDPSVRSFWVDEFAKYTDRYAQEATPAIQNKIGQFASNALVRNVIGQETSSFDLRDIMDSRKIFIVNLSKGRVGEGNANLLGSMLITKMYLAAMSRADVPLSEQRNLPPFYLFVDEFQNFANKSFAEILSEARKYKLSLTIAHQYIEQMEEEVRAAVFGNVGTMITFRVGAYDADVLEKEFAPTFELDDLVNLGARQIYLKLMIDSVSSQPFSATTMPPIPEPEVNQSDRAIAYSRAQYARPRAEVEKTIRDWSERKYEDPDAEVKERAREERRAVRDMDEGRPPRDNAPQTQRAPYPDRAPRPDSAVRSNRDSAPRPMTRTDRPPSREGGYREREPARESARHAPREGYQSTTPVRAPALAPAPRPLPPRPVPVRKEENRDDLRNILAKIAKPQEQVSGVSLQLAGGATDDRSQINVHRSATVNQRSGNEGHPSVYETREMKTTVLKAESSKLQAPTRDDGKGVTDEGRSELRNLLATLTNSSASTANTEKNTSTNTSISVTTSHPPATVAPALAERSAEPKSATLSHDADRLAPAPATPERNTRPQELSPDALENMLHVDKPQSLR